MEKVLETLGLGIPFYLAAVTYGGFRWLDANASDEATRIISLWLQGRSRRKVDLGNTILSAFDRLYTAPLLTTKAFFRSATISLCIWLMVFIVPLFIPNLRHLIKDSHLPLFVILVLVPTVLIQSLSIVIISDYASLFLVRYFLNLAKHHPIVAVVASSFAGILVVSSMIVIMMLIPEIAMDNAVSGSFTSGPRGPGYDKLIQFFEYFVSYAGDISAGTGLSAWIIYLWLPLFILASMGVRLVFVFLHAVEWAQWFLRQGDLHPLQAVGLVATVLVFVGTIAAREGWLIVRPLYVHFF